MNIKEVYILNMGLEGFYVAREYPYLYTQIGRYSWYIEVDKITADTHPVEPRFLVGGLFRWVFR